MRRSSGALVRYVTTLAVVGALLLAGCGSDGGEDVATADPVAEEPTPTDPAGEEPGEGEPTGGSEAPPDDGTSAGDVDACAIVDTLDVAALLGEDPAPRDDETSELGAACVVAPADPDSRAALRLVVETERGPENYARQRELLGVDSEPTGLGDEAFHTGPYLFVLDGDTLVFIQVLRDSTKGVAVDDAELEAAMVTALEAVGP